MKGRPQKLAHQGQMRASNPELEAREVRAAELQIRRPCGQCDCDCYYCDKQNARQSKSRIAFSN